MRRQIRQLSTLLHLGRQNSTASTLAAESMASTEPVARGISLDLQKRISDLKRSLREERRALEESEQRFLDLERKYQELLSTRNG